MIREILLLGDERLYQPSAPITQSELPSLAPVICDLHDTLLDFRRVYGAGRAIAAPQIGFLKRMIYLFIDSPTVFINPRLEFSDNEMMEVLDDCMSFPKLYVRLMRRKRCTIHFYDTDWTPRQMQLEGDLSELLQHEYDHLDGILATMRAADTRALVMKR